MTFRVHGYAFLALLALMFFSAASAPTPRELGQKIALQTEDSLFNYDFWMLDSSWLKLQISALGAPRFSDSVTQRQSVLHKQHRQASGQGDHQPAKRAGQAVL